MSFNAAAHMRKIRTRQGMQDYLDVKWRLMWLRSEHPDASILTEVVRMDDAGALFKATITYRTNVVVGRDGGTDYIEPSDDAMTVVTSHGSETQQDFPDYIEKAETKAIGRACAVAGYGTDAAADFDDGVPMDGAAAAKGEPDRKLEPHERQQVDQQHERNTGASNLHQHAQLRSIAEHGFDLAPRLAALGIETIEELSREQAMELIVAGRQSVRGEGNAPTAPPPRQPPPSTLPATRTHPQQPDGQDRARQNIAEKMAARGLPVLPMDTYAEIAETVNNALKAARCEARVQPGGRDGEVRPGDILNALMALPSAVPTGA